MKNILIVGATSAIAEACARQWLKEYPNSNFVLTGRSEKKLMAVKSDLEIRGAGTCRHLLLDLNDVDAFDKLLPDTLEALNQLDIVLVAPGTLPDHEKCMTDKSYAQDVFQINATSTMLLLEILAAQLESQRVGQLVVISSVAGDRGRMSNYYYGAAKAAVTAFCSGLMMRLQKSNVSVSIVKPGFVRTPMTADLDLPEKLVATPEAVAKHIVSNVKKQRSVIYAPSIWRFIMTIIRLIPTSIFRRLSL